MDILKKLQNETTYLVIDQKTNRFNFCGLAEVDEQVVADSVDGEEYDLNSVDGEEVEINETLLLNGAKSWKDFSWGGSGLISNAEIAEHYSTPSELKYFLTKDGGIKRDTNSAGEHLLDIQARALRQAWWAIRDEMNGTTEFSMSLCEFSGEGKEQGYYEENEDEDDENFSIVDDTKDVLKATGKLAGNIVKNTTDKCGILMF